MYGPKFGLLNKSLPSKTSTLAVDGGGVLGGEKIANLVFQCLFKYGYTMVFLNDHSASGRPTRLFADQKYLVVLICAHYLLWNHNGESLDVLLLVACLASGNCDLIPSIGQVFEKGVCGGG